MLTRATRSVAAISAAASLGVMGYAGDLSSPGLIALAAGFSAWLCAPNAVAWVASVQLQGDQVASGTIALGLVVAAGFGFYAYYTTFINNIKPGAQDGMVFMVIPLYQLMALLLVWAMALMVKRLRNK